MTITPTVQFGTEDINGLTAATLPIVAPAMIQNPVNLLRASRTPADSTNGRWVNGFAYTPEGIGEIAVDDNCAGEHESLPAVASFVSDWTPYFLTAKYECSTFGYNENDYVDRAKRLLEAATPKLLEWEFWDGKLSAAANLNNTWLASLADPALKTIDISTNQHAVLSAMGVLENYLGACAYGGRGMIHIPPYLAPFMGIAGCRREGNLLLTNRDTIVVPGSGYAEPAGGLGAPPIHPTVDIYATGITDVRIGDIFVDDTVSFDRATNSVTIRAYRPACVSWDELCFAKVTITT
jgi:hypothetical protein